MPLQIKPIAGMPEATSPLAAAPVTPAILPAGTPAPKWRNSGRPLIHLADRIFGRPVCITRSKGDTILAVLGPRLGLAAEAIPVMVAVDEEEDEEAPYTVDNGIACIPVQGTLVKRAGGLRALSGLPSYESLRAQIGQAMADPEVQGLCFDFDSPGGEASGCADLCDYLYSFRGTKPMYAVANDEMCSAAYWIASACDRIYSTRDGMLGSIGCYMMHVDQSKRDEQNGLAVTYIQAGARKTDGNSHEPLSDTAEATMQAEVNRIRDMFATAVARNRNCAVQSLLDLEGDVKFADAAIPLLADQVGMHADAVRDLRAELGIPEQPDEDDDECDPDNPDELCHSQSAAASIDPTGVFRCQKCAKPRERMREVLAFDRWAELTEAREIAQRTGVELLVRITPQMRDSLAAQLPALNATRAKHGLPPLFRLLDRRAPEAQAAAIPPHKTATSDKPWDGPANEARLKTDQNQVYYRKAYAWQEDGSDGTKKNQFKFIHHEVSAAGASGPANVQGCRTGIEALNGARGGTTIPAKDRKGVWDHLAKHMRDAGAEPPELKSEVQLEAEAMLAMGGDRLTMAQRMFNAATALNARRWCDIEGYSGNILLAMRCFGKAQVDDTYHPGQGSADSRHIICCVAPYNQLSADLGGFQEVYQPGCFSEWLQSGEDARALWNHEPLYVLGRRAAETARFYEQPDGFYFDCEAPATGWADDLLVSMRRKDVTGGSAAFFIVQPRWEYRNGGKVRVIEKARLVEGSVASFPIYEGSRASVQPAEPAAVAADVDTPPGLCEARLRLLRLR